MKQYTLVEKNTVDLTIRLIHDMYPQYYEAAVEYLHGVDYLGYNCFILKKELFYQMCEFQFGILFELEKQIDTTNYKGNMLRSCAYMGELLYAIYFFWLKKQSQFKIKELQLVFFSDTTKQNRNVRSNHMTYLSLRQKYERSIKHIFKKILPQNMSLMVEKILKKFKNKYIPPLIPNKQSPAFNCSILIKQNQQRLWWKNQTLTYGDDVETTCFALEIHGTHKASFSEFRCCHTGRSVVVVATGPSMQSYSPIPGIPHIGVNSAFKNEKIKLDYYFTTDYESRNDWFAELKNYDFIKFFGQYSAGVFRDKYQISENLVYENHARRFFQGAPNEHIHLNIEYYPLMGFYSIAFQAIHFALYTNPKRIFLVGCDCSGGGYFDGSKQIFAEAIEKTVLPKWVRGYQKLKGFTERFYPETEIISINPVGLKGLFHDVYTEEYLAGHPEIDRNGCEILDISKYGE